MNLPITLVLLTAVGHAASQFNTTPRSPTTGQTTKRELLEGNFGQRTELLNKYAPLTTTPGIQYADDFKQQFDEQATAEQIFGVRLHQIPKISDLLSGHGPPFDVALTHHLYAPVSVYNPRFQPLASQDFFEIPATAATKNIFSDAKNFKQQKLLSEEDNHLKQSQDQNNLFSLRIADFQLNKLAPGFSFEQFRYPDQLQAKGVSGAPFPSFDQSFKDPGPLQYGDRLQQQLSTNLGPIDPGVDYKNRGNGDDRIYSKEQSNLQKDVLTKRPESEQQPSIPNKAYHAHPNGAISYSNFVHNQPHLYIQADQQQEYKQPSKIPQQSIEGKLNNKKNQGPEPQPSQPQPQGQSLALPVNQQQYIPISQKEFFQGPFQQPLFIQSEPQIGQLSNSQFAPNIQTQYKHLYLNPVRQQLLHEIHKGHELQSLKIQQQSSLEQLPNIRPNMVSIVESTTYSPLTHQSVPQSTRQPNEKPFPFLDQSSTQTSTYSERDYKPTPVTGTYKENIIPLHAHPSTLEPELAITPKSRITHLDQIVQSTTIQPDTIKDGLKKEAAESKSLDKGSSKVEAPQSILPSLLVSPLKLQSLSPRPTEYHSSSTPLPVIPARSEQTYIQTKPHHSVQIQQQDFHEIHSQLKPQNQGQPEQKLNLEGERQEHQSLEGTPQKQEPIPTPPVDYENKPDYEIEIASHVDHSQLPRDLQPVLTEPEETNQKPVRNHEEQTKQKKIHSFAEPLRSFDELAINHNVHTFDHNSPFLFPFLNPYQPAIQQRNFPNSELLQPEFYESPFPTFAPVQYFGKYARSIFKNT